MKKNKAMRLASALLVLALLTTCVISSTFAKYTTSATGTDTARVAKWGFEATDSSIVLTDLFRDAYDKNVSGAADVIAPGTANSAVFGFTYGGAGGITAPEVAYTFEVSTTGSSCADAIRNNAGIQWKLDSGDWGTWDQMINDIEALDGNVPENTAKGTPADYYAANSLPAAFNATGENQHTVYWQWVFDNNGDSADTTMGNADDLADVTLKITITATQVD